MTLVVRGVRWKDGMMLGGNQVVIVSGGSARGEGRRPDGRWITGAAVNLLTAELAAGDDGLIKAQTTR